MVDHMSDNNRSQNGDHPRLADGQKIVVKVGSRLVVAPGAGSIRRTWINAMASDIADLRQQGKDVLLVSSGAIAMGCRIMGLDRRRLRLEQQQAAAAIGQGYLFDAWRRAFSGHAIIASQILLTLEDTERRRRYLNARETLSELSHMRVQPIINENDTLATDEIRFGDNDRLAARIAQIVNADTLVLLSHIDGLYSSDPSEKKPARHIPLVNRLTPDIRAMAGKKISDQGSGGMMTKLEAAKITAATGCRMVLADGRARHALGRVDHPDVRKTWFMPRPGSLGLHKQWIAGTLHVGGSVVIDDGAVAALARGKSLLPAGVTRIDGHFERGDTVHICRSDGQVLGCGLSAWSADDAKRIMGQKSDEIASILGYPGRGVMIHRDDMVLE